METKTAKILKKRFTCIYTEGWLFKKSLISVLVIFERRFDHDGMIINQTPCGHVTNDSRRIRGLLSDPHKWNCVRAAGSSLYS